MHISRGEPRAIKGSRHFHVTVHALFTQNGDSWSDTGIYVRRGNVVVHVETQLRMQTGIGKVENAIVFRLRAFRVIAQLLHLISGLRPGTMQVDALLSEYRLIVAQKLNFILAIEITDSKTHVAQTLFRQGIHHITIVLCFYLDYRP